MVISYYDYFDDSNFFVEHEKIAHDVTPFTVLDDDHLVCSNAPSLDELCKDNGDDNVMVNGL